MEGGEIAQPFQIGLAQHPALGTEALAMRQAILGADADPAGITEGLAQLDGGRADAAGAGMQQYLFARLQCGQIEQVAPGSRPDLGQRRGLNQRQAFRH